MSVGKANKRSKVLRRNGYRQKPGLSGSIISLPPKMELSALRDGEPCTHPGCLRHLTHPCEGCGRVGGRSRCEHDRLNEDGICRACGEDRRGI